MRWFAIGSVVLLCNCSFVVVSPPPATPDHPCTTSLVSPAVDTVAAVVGLVVAGLALTDLESTDSSGGGAETVAISAGIAGVLYGIAAGYGYHEVGRCRDAASTRRAAP
jgi:hypothetical protein